MRNLVDDMDARSVPAFCKALYDILRDINVYEFMWHDGEPKFVITENNYDDEANLVSIHIGKDVIDHLYLICKHHSSFIFNTTYYEVAIHTPEIQVGTYYEDCRCHPMYCVSRDNHFNDLKGIDLKQLFEIYGHTNLDSEDIPYDRYSSLCSITSCGARPLFKEEAEEMAREKDTRGERYCAISEQTGDYAVGGRFRMDWMNEVKPTLMIWDEEMQWWYPASEG